MLDDVSHEEEEHHCIDGHAHPYVSEGEHLRDAKHAQGKGEVDGNSLDIVLYGVIMLPELKVMTNLNILRLSQ